MERGLLLCQCLGFGLLLVTQALDLSGLLHDLLGSVR
jgi:hypothetical protein